MEEIVSSISNLAETLSKPSISDWTMVVITTVYVIATCLICYFNRKSADAAALQLEEAKQALEESRKQQQQNAGIQLYCIRKEFITLFSSKKYNEVFWDASILFSEKAADQVQKTAYEYERYTAASAALENYTNRMREDDPDLYAEYCRLSNTHNENDLDSLVELCSRYSPIIEDIDGQTHVLKYSDLVAEYQERRSKHGAIHLEAFMQLKKELAESIK